MSASSRPYKASALMLASAILSLQTAAAAEALQSGKILHYANQFPPSVCAVLSARPLPGAENYVQVLKDGQVIDSPVSLGESEICVNNLVHGQHYQLKLLQGMPAAGGLTLPADQSIDITIPDAKEELSFKPGTLLPRAAKSFLELDSVNLKQVKLYLFKLSLNDLSALNLNQLLSYQLDNGTLTDLLESHASLISSQLIELKAPANQKLTTRLDLSRALQQSQGLILALACDPTLDLGLDNHENVGSALGSIYNLYDSQKAFASKLINVTNFTISSFKGSSLTVQVHNLQNAEPVGGAEVTLLSRNNSALGSLKTDKNGLVSFAPELLQGKRADSPAALMVQKNGDLALLSLNSPEIFLPENGVNPPLKGQVQVFATAGRGIFRPGEELNLSAFLRDDKGNATTAPVSLILQGPNGVELYRTLLQGNELGTYFVNYALSQAAARGSYSALFKQGETELQRLSFEVADFVPATLKLSADSEAGALKSGGSGAIVLKADFNYGQPAENLDTSATAALEPDPQPLAQYADFHFGPANPWELQQSLPLEAVRTDKNGEARFALNIPKLSWAAKLSFSGTVYDLNREQSVTFKEFKLSPETALIGLKDEPNKDEIALVYTGSDGKEQQGKLDYTVYKLTTNFQYIFEYGRWNYRRQSIRHPVASGSIEVNGRASLPLTLADGQYLIEARDQQGAVSSLNFTQGYMTDAGLESPERIALALNQETFKAGESVKVSFDSPFEGWATLLAARDTVLDTRSVKVKKGHNQIAFDFKEQYAPGIKVLVSLYAPLEDNPAGAVRALGQISVSADNSARRINLKAEAPAEAKPGDTLHIKVSSNSKEEFYLQPYLVDSGILSLTGFKTPDPFSAVFGPKASALTLQDSYRFLLRQSDPYSQGYGADENFKAFAQALSALSTIPREIYAKALPPVLVKNGSAELNFTAPELSGELTLMLTAASKEGLGALSEAIILKDELNVTEALPRFLRAGDEAQAALSLHNTGSAASFKVKLNCSGSLDCALQQVVTLKAGESKNLPFALSAAADNPGTGSVSFEIEGLNGSKFSTQRSASLQVLPAWSKALYSQVQKLEPGAQAEVDFGGVQFAALDGAATSFSLLPLINSELFLQRLQDEPDWSAMITAFKVLSMVKAAEARLPGASAKELSPESVQLLTDKMLSRQQGDGSFNLYGYTRDYYTTALSALTLCHLKAAGYAVPEDALKRALTAAEKAARYGSDSARALAYYTLLQYAQASPSDLYYFASSEDLKSVEALALAARCFALSGDAAKAAELAASGVQAFKEMAELRAKLDALPYTDEKQEERGRLNQRLTELAPSAASDLLHDGFLLLTLPLSAEDNRSVVNTLLSLKSSTDSYRAADLAAMICAQAELTADMDSAGAQLAAKSVEHEGLPPYQIKNDSSTALYANSTAYGLSASAPEPVSAGLALSKDYFTLDGKPVTLPAAVKVNEPLIVRLKTRLLAPASGTLIVRDALPTAFKGSEASGLDAALHEKLCGDVWSYPENTQISESEYLSILNTYQTEQCLLYLQQPGFNGSFALPAARAQLGSNNAVQAATAVKSAAFTAK
ncbi:MAG: hypothetical protein IAB19_09640 [Proteobacteria bacterium]|uniref:Alpha-2-macroglobulin domain-containing protein n=1 Tax=Candidatus Avisuccinivibrio stercorigallinarum TaxID=2840704 RepID=A0A9D9DC04_9GAMM|nr:hypothetical protein [Candidatus Avisuccinivibrio stercorigallinarum]